jgi:hypothetical protein
MLLRRTNQAGAASRVARIGENSSMPNLWGLLNEILLGHLADVGGDAPRLFTGVQLGRLVAPVGYAVPVYRSSPDPGPRRVGPDDPGQYALPARAVDRGTHAEGRTSWPSAQGAVAKILAEYTGLQEPLTVTPAGVADAFVKANPGLSAHDIASAARSGWG